MTMPSSWKLVRVGDIASLLNGYAFASQGFSTSGGVPLIRIRDLGSKTTEINFVGDFPNQYVVKNGDLLIGMDGDFNVVKWNGGYALLNQRVCKLGSMDASVLCDDFLFHRIIGEIAKINRITAATTVKHLASKDVIRIELQLPPSAEQSKIAEVLSTVDRAIAQTEALIAKQQRIKTGLMQDLLTRGIDKHGQLRYEATHAFKDSSLGRIPVEWEVTALEEVADVSGGKRLPAGHSYAEGKTGFVYLRVLDFYNREIDVDSLVSLEGDTFQTLQRYEIRDGELCISIAGSLGYVSVLRLRTDMRAILTENALRIVPGSEIDADYLCMAMNGLAVQTQVEALKGTGGGVPKLALHRVKSLSVAFPKDKMEQERIIGIMTAHAKNALKVNKTLHKLQRLKTALMQDLLTGKVRVTPLLQAAEETASA